MVNGRFGFLCNLTEMEVLEPRDLGQSAEKLMKIYSLDLDDSLWKEVVQFGGLEISGMFS